MASEEHKQLSQYIKEVHSTLRKSSLRLGAKQAWLEHCRNNDILTKYAQCMEKLATAFWVTNSEKNMEVKSRIRWTVDLCFDYFVNMTYLKYREKEINIANKIDVHISCDESFSEPLKLIDVGSCYNPFKIYEIFDVFAIDLCPANPSVFQCDFLNVSIDSSNMVTHDNKVQELQEASFDIVTFCFLLEYIPTSDLRIIACQKAYSLLRYGGLLIINTPDSKHVGANSKIMKCWRYSLALIGFNRIKYEKFKHMHCMAFRKSVDKEVAARWAKLHEQSYMEFAINIPQDFNNDDNSVARTIPIGKETLVDDFRELPFVSYIE